MIRRRFLDDLDAIDAGKDPKATVRDPAVNASIELPVAERRALVDGFSRAQLMRDAFNRRSLQGYIFQTGQPKEVHDAYLAAMGINATDIEAAEVAIDPLAPINN
jgi:5,5'-dehydrodivanillate O-demethylase